MWSPTPEAVSAANQHTPYAKAPLWIGHNQLSIDPRIVELAHRLKSEHPWILTCYSTGRTRTMLPSMRLDMHQAGRALDVMIPPEHRSNGDGAALASWLVENHIALKLQLVKYNMNEWQSNTGSFYHGDSSHDNHIHIEVNGDGADPASIGSGSAPSAPLPARSADPESTDGDSELVFSAMAIGCIAVAVVGLYLLVR